jgi:hypothetical protein
MWTLRPGLLSTSNFTQPLSADEIVKFGNQSIDITGHLTYDDGFGNIENDPICYFMYALGPRPGGTAEIRLDTCGNREAINAIYGKKKLFEP